MSAASLGPHEADLELVRPVVGMHVHALKEWERSAFDRLCEAGLARRSYGFLRIPRVSLQPDRGGQK